MAKILFGDGRTKEVEPLNKKYFTLEELQKIVGGIIEIIYLNNNLIMVIDEEGKIKNKGENDNATLVAQRQLGGMDYVVGDALVCKRNEVK